jgi:hypothetical protein
MTKWTLKSSHVELPDTGGSHPTITESTTGTVACGCSGCDGRCGLPALTLTYRGEEFRAFGVMVACGMVFQPFRVPWQGEKIAVRLPEDMSPSQAMDRYWG